MKTYRGITQRTTNGRFLYGRTGNYRLTPCLMSLVNETNTIGSISPHSGTAPLSTTALVHAETPGSLTPGIQSNWPSNGDGMSKINNAGGIAVQNSGYARTAGASAITVLKTWQWGNDTSTDVSFGSSTGKSYTPAGTYVPALVCHDALKRVTTQTLAAVVVSA